MDKLDKLITEINKFRDDRNWRQYHTAKDLALSVSLEASELLENFQWKDSAESIAKNKENISDEMADVFIYLMMLATDLDVNFEEIVMNKLSKNNLKYPVDKTINLKTK